MKKLKQLLYGADAVYMGTSNLSLRSRVTVDDDELIKTVEYAHSINKKVYVALNIYARDNMYLEIEDQIKILKKAKVDAFIISDGGIVEMAKNLAPEIPIHISTQANITSYHTSNFWKKNGAERVILARELNKKEIKDSIKYEDLTEKQMQDIATKLLQNKGFEKLSTIFESLIPQSY